MSSFFDLEMKDINGESVAFSKFRDQVSLVVNVASKWGLTPQYAGLRTLHDDNVDAGFNVLAFPCNQFAGQEPGTNAEILEFATSNYGVTFPMFEKIDVNGDDAAPLYQLLRSEQPGDGETSDIAWNFTKFLVARDGTVIKRYEPQVTPEEIGAELAQYL